MHIGCLLSENVISIDGIITTSMDLADRCAIIKTVRTTQYKQNRPTYISLMLG